MVKYVGMMMPFWSEQKTMVENFEGISIFE